VCWHRTWGLHHAFGAKAEVGSASSALPERNFDTDDDPTNPMEIDCQEPTRNLSLSSNIDPLAVMNSARGQPDPVPPSAHQRRPGRARFSVSGLLAG